MARLSRRADLWLSAAILVVVALALALNFPHDSLWYDDALTTYVANDSWATLWRWCTQVDIQVPLHYGVLRIWTALAGDTEFAVRALSALCVPLTVAGTIAAGRGLIRRAGVGQIAGTFIGLLPGMYWVAYEVRAYALALALYAWATAFLIVILNRLRDQSRGLLLWIGGYTALMAATLYTHYTAQAAFAGHLALVALAGVGPFLRFVQRKGAAMALVRLAAPVALAGIAFLPWVPIVLARGAADRSYYPGQPILPDRAVEVMAGFKLLARQDQPEVALPLIAGYAVLMCVGLIGGLVMRPTRRGAAVGGLLAAIPLAITIVIVYLNPKLTGRYFWPAWIGLDLLAATALSVVLPRRAGITLLVAGTLIAIPWLTGQRGSSPDSDYRGAFAYLCTQGTPDDVILLRDGTLFVTEWYYGRRAPCDTPRYTIPMPEALITDVTRFLSLPQTQAAMRDIANRQPPNVWVISWQGDTMDPQALTYALLDQTAAHTVRARMFGDVRLDRYERIYFPALAGIASDWVPVPAPQYADLPLPVGYPKLITTQLFAPPVAHTGDIIVLQAWWRRGASLQPDLRVSAKLTTLDGGWTYAQVDQPPAGWKFVDDRWEADTPALGRYELPIGPDVPAGRVAVRYVLYDALSRWEPVVLTIGEVQVAG